MHLLPISAGDIAEKVGMDYRTVGQILKNLGLETRAVKREGQTKRCIVYDKAKLETLRRRYMAGEDSAAEDAGSVSNVARVSSPGGYTPSCNHGDNLEDPSLLRGEL